MGDWEQKNHLINELAEGRELAKQLQSYLNLPFSSNETQQVLAQRIVASYEKAISMLNCSVGTSSPPSLNGSPRSDQDSDPEHRNTRLGKRKSMPKWTKQVRVGPGMGIEGPLEDGFSWRKYGQKDILGAKHPRGYYRCTHRHGRGCLATKQVQRSDEDPTILDVSYKGSHTCNNLSAAAAVAPPPPPAVDQTYQQPTQQNQSEEQLLMNYFRVGLKVLTDDLDTNHQENTVIPSFNYPSSSSVQNWQNNLPENNFTPPFLSPATSGTSYFSASPSGFNSYQNFHSDQLTEIISSPAATSGTNSPTIGNLDFQFGNAHEFDPHFTFDNPGFFS